MLTPSFAALLLSILLTWLVYGWVCLGFGWAVVRFLRLGDPKASDFVWAFWIGFGVVLTLLELWNFVWPVNGYAHLVIVGAGVLLSLQAIPGLFRCAAEAPRGECRAFFLASLALALWLADRSAGPGSFYDAGLYHLPAIQWAEQFRVVPGLANLHYRLGFTGCVTLLAALMDQGIWAGKANHIMNGFMLTALGAMMVRGILGVLRPDHWRRPGAWFMAVSTIALVEWGLDVQVSSFSTDIGVVVFTLLAVGCFLESRASDHDAGRQRFLLFGSVTLCAMSVATKLSAAAFSGPLALGALFLLWRSKYRTRIPLGRSALVLVLPALLAGGWVARSIVLTGYPLYPAAILSLPVDWRCPPAVVQSNGRVVRDFARWGKNEDTTKDYRWVPVWVKTRLLVLDNIWKSVIPAGEGLLGLAGALVLFRRWRTLGPGWLDWWWIYGCIVSGVYVWFYTAADPRYSSQLFYVLCAGGVSLLAANLAGSRLGFRVAILAALLLLSCGPLVHRTLATYGTLAGMGKMAWMPPGPDGGFHPTPVTASLRTAIIPPHTTIYLPPEGTDQTWVAPLPSSPYIDPRLRLRDPPRLRGGFKLVEDSAQ